MDFLEQIEKFGKPITDLIEQYWFWIMLIGIGGLIIIGVMSLIKIIFG